MGCGTGQATLPLARLRCHVVAMDLSPGMAAIARRIPRHRLDPPHRRRHKRLLRRRPTMLRTFRPHTTTRRAPDHR
ncbi:class I SAM-dependent methyltransferase [Paractinoplanes atraurantiacus]|uniref:class I SAM-dependent methyltransferase n=1 Tax=Paractinoplanes atraurantiacus TaxID=1036182 RepID=UPI000BE37E86